ncbi:hypothetical protein OJAV_G00005830 [Oryzias javanicus]|uniref:Uncharacterized protein n=1 Tax=Oryzias javanicus TaxID=123683 RepID=A0A3S2UQM5_ORYJA|nr:hypothetical protein OJAV_G00005830 [Oryzias javanicus]
MQKPGALARLHNEAPQCGYRVTKLICIREGFTIDKTFPGGYWRAPRIQDEALLPEAPQPRQQTSPRSVTQCSQRRTFRQHLEASGGFRGRQRGGLSKKS